MVQSDQDALGHPQRSGQAQQWKNRKYQLCPSKIDKAHVYILFFRDESIQNGPVVYMVLSDTLSDLVKLNYDEYSKYQVCIKNSL